MKTVRTRVKSAFNTKRTNTRPLNDLLQDVESPTTSVPISAATSVPPILPPPTSTEQQLTQDPLVNTFIAIPPPPPPPAVQSSRSLTPDSERLIQSQMAGPYIPEFHLDSDPFADLSSPLRPDTPIINSILNKTRRNTVTKDAIVTREIPTEESVHHFQPYQGQDQQQRREEDTYNEDQGEPIAITDDSRRSTPKKRKKILTVIPPTPGSTPAQVQPETTPVTVAVSAAAATATTADQNNEPKIESSPVNVNLSYFPTEPERHQSLLDQPEPTESAFNEITPPTQSMSIVPPLHEILLNEKYQLQSQRTDSPIQIQPDHLSPYNPNDESKPLLDPSFQTSEIDHILESSTVWPLPPQTFPTLGWTEHVLPSSAYYYSHAATRTVTDLDLRDNKKLDALTHYLEAKRSPNTSSGSNLKLASATSDVDIQVDQNLNGLNGTSGRDTNTIRTLRTEPEFLAEEGIDIWIRDANASGASNNSGAGTEWSFMPLTNWVMHATRAVSYDPPSDKDPAPEDLSDAERLSLEFKYWQYMCTHPAHVSVPQSAYDEALEVLTWCYTDSVLRADSPPPLVPFPPPFTFKECTALLELIRNISSSAASPASQTIRTRLIAQILLRYTEWRQKYITKSVPVVLPSNNNSINSTSTISARSAPAEVEQAIPFKRSLEKFVKSILCLGIPYFFERNGNSSCSTNEEEQGERGVDKTPKVNVSIDASQPIMAALVLSGSVTMLTFPNLNQATRVSAMISALFAITSMASYGISLYGRSSQQKRDSNSCINHDHEPEHMNYTTTSTQTVNVR